MNKKMIEAFTIFLTYGEYFETAAEHDVIFAGPDPKVVSKEDLEKLEKLGWGPDDEYGCDCFVYFT